MVRLMCFETQRNHQIIPFSCLLKCWWRNTVLLFSVEGYKVMVEGCRVFRSQHKTRLESCVTLHHRQPQRTVTLGNREAQKKLAQQTQSKWYTASFPTAKCFGKTNSQISYHVSSRAECEYDFIWTIWECKSLSRTLIITNMLNYIL